MTDTPETLDLDKLATWCRNHVLAAWCRGGEQIASNTWFGPSALMRQPWNLTRNAAASALEALEARGDLERIPGQALAWKLAPAPPQPDRGYSLPLSPAEHGALLRALDSILEPFLARHGAHIGGDVNTLIRLRSRLLRKEKP